MIERILANEQVKQLCEAGDFGGAAVTLNELAEPQPKPAAESRANWNRLTDLFGLERVVAWRMSMKATLAGLRSIIAALPAEARLEPSMQAERLELFLEAMAGSGYPFNDTRTLEQLAELAEAEVITSQDFADLKAVGWLPPQTVTLDEVRVAWSSHVEAQAETRRQASRSAVIATLRRLASTIEETSELPTLNDLQSTIAANWPRV